MGAIRRLRAHAGKREPIEFTESEIFLSKEQERERIERLAEDILDAYRFLESERRGRRKHVRDSGLDESRAIFEEVSEDLEKRLAK